jgi:hypothetical protein
LKALRTLVSLLLVFILVANLFVLQFLLLTEYKLTGPGFYLDGFAGYGLYDELHYYLDENVKAQARAYGLPPDALAGVITREWVELQSKTLVTGLLAYLKGKEADLPQLDFETPTDRFIANIDAFIDDLPGLNGLGAGDAVTDYIRENFSRQLSGLPFSSNWAPQQKRDMIRALEAPRQMLAKLQPALYFSAGLTLFILIFLFFAWRDGMSWLNWAGTALALGGFLTMIPSFFALLLVKSNPGIIPGLLNQGFYDLVAAAPLKSIPLVIGGLAKSMLQSLLTYGIVLTLLGIALIAVVPPAIKMTRNIRPGGKERAV